MLNTSCFPILILKCTIPFVFARYPMSLTLRGRTVFVGLQSRMRMATGEAMWLGLPSRLRLLVDRSRGNIWLLQKSVVIRFLYNLAGELLVYGFIDDELVFEGFVFEIETNPLNSQKFYLAVTLMATVELPGRRRMAGDLQVIGCFQSSVQVDDLFDSVDMDTPWRWIPQFVQRADSHRSANVIAVVWQRVWPIVRVAWLRHRLAVCASHVLGSFRVPVPGFPSLVLHYAVGPRADDAWRILAAIAEANFPDYDAEGKMSWMGTESDLRVVLAQLQAFSDGMRDRHDSMVWRKATAFTVGGHMQEFFGVSMNSEWSSEVKFFTGVKLFKWAAREVFKQNTLLSTWDIWQTFTLTAMLTWTEVFAYLYLWWNCITAFS